MIVQLPNEPDVKELRPTGAVQAGSIRPKFFQHLEGMKYLIAEKSGYPLWTFHKRNHNIGITVACIPFTLSPLFSFDPDVVALHQ